MHVQVRDRYLRGSDRFSSFSASGVWLLQPSHSRTRSQGITTFSRACWLSIGILVLHAKRVAFLLSLALSPVNKTMLGSNSFNLRITVVHLRWSCPPPYSGTCNACRWEREIEDKMGYGSKQNLQGTTVLFIFLFPTRPLLERRRQKTTWKRRSTQHFCIFPLKVWRSILQQILVKKGAFLWATGIGWSSLEGHIRRFLDENTSWKLGWCCCIFVEGRQFNDWWVWAVDHVGECLIFNAGRQRSEVINPLPYLGRTMMVVGLDTAKAP